MSSFGLASTSCRTFGGLIGSHGFACSHRDRGVLGDLGRVTRFRKCVARTTRRFGTLRGGLGRGLSHSLSCFTGPVGRCVSRRVIAHCFCRHNTIVRHLGSSASLRRTVGMLRGPIHCQRVLSTPVGGSRPIGGRRPGGWNLERTSR